MRRPKRGKLACPAQGARILAFGEYPGGSSEKNPKTSLQIGFAVV